MDGTGRRQRGGGHAIHDPARHRDGQGRDGRLVRLLDSSDEGSVVPGFGRLSCLSQFIQPQGDAFSIGIFDETLVLTGCSAG